MQHFEQSSTLTPDSRLYSLAFFRNIQWGVASAVEVHFKAEKRDFHSLWPFEPELDLNFAWQSQGPLFQVVEA